MAGNATCGSMTPIQRQRRSALRRSKTLSIGSVSNQRRSPTLAITSTSFTRRRRNSSNAEKHMCVTVEVCCLPSYMCDTDNSRCRDQGPRGGEEHGPRFRCAQAEQSVEKNLEEFPAVRDGKYKPREAFLRMKQDIEDGDPQMWDLAAYRVLDAEHHRTSPKWKIYPTYDFTDCLWRQLRQYYTLPLYSRVYPIENIIRMAEQEFGCIRANAKRI
jgi:hypothetical protein